MRAKKFLRRNTGNYSRLGRGRKKLQKWRRPKGRDNKMRLKEKGRPRSVEIGYKKPQIARGKVDGKEIKFVQNFDEMKSLKKGEVIMLGRFGAKKKMELSKFAKDHDIKITNFSFNKFNRGQKRKKSENSKKEIKEEKK